MSPNPYVRTPLRYTWWLHQGRYVRYVCRESSCIFIGAYSVVVIIGLVRLSQGAAEFDGFVAALRSPVSIVFHLAALIFALYHTVTWFNVTPKAMPLRIGNRLLPDGVIIGGHYLGWAAVSALVLFLVGIW